MKNLSIIVGFYFISFGLFSQEYIENCAGDYFGQVPPSDSAKIFAPGIISVSNRYEYGLAISPSHDEYFYTAEQPGNSESQSGLLHIKRNGNKWLKPELANLNQSGLWEQEAFFTPDGNSVYYAVSDSTQTKIWFSNKTENGWSKGEFLNSSINESANRLFYTTFSSNENLYYTNVDEFKIYCSKKNDGKYNDFYDIGLPRAGHAFVAPDESFIIFDSRGEDTYGKLDIYVIFKTENGQLSGPVNFGGKINTEFSETCPSLSPDGKYIFFGRYNDENEKSNIYWISSDIINDIKQGL